MEDINLRYDTGNSTPAMTQYFEIKTKYPGCILMFRMGDFYEMFFDDAKLASPILGVALTHRGKHINSDIPMCGIPFSALDSYVGKLVKNGYKVAICDQIETPKEAKQRGANAVIRRSVTRVLTAGTIIEDSLLSSKKNNYLMSIVPDICNKTKAIKIISYAVIDISTGEFFVNSVIEKEFCSILSAYSPTEILISSEYENDDRLSKYISSNCDAYITHLPISKFNHLIEKDRLEKYFNVTTLDSFGININNELSACGSILEYIIITQKDNATRLPIPRKSNLSHYLIIDSSTSKSLEIVHSSSGFYKGSLLGAIDETKTAFGARMLAARVCMPTTSKELIEQRLDCVSFFINNDKISDLIRTTLSACPDFERAINRIKFKKFSPRDVGYIRESLRVIMSVKGILSGVEIPSDGEYSIEKVDDFTSLLRLLDSAIVEDIPVAIKDSGVIKDGYLKKLDEVKYLKSNSEQLISSLQTKYIAETGINTLKIKNNGILGWYIELPLSQKSKIGEDFIHRQTLINAARYTTNELSELQIKLIEAFEIWINLEVELFNEVVEKMMKFSDSITYAIKFLSCLDVYTNFASISQQRNYVRPTISDDSVLDVVEGRHPMLEVSAQEFTANDCCLNNSKRISLLTGPNMSGKSTYLRQNALLLILSQIGCFVPAKKATIGIADRIFSRIGASDDIARGRSTFMVEMIETATILNQATKKSFVILDEVGRGTSTYDGLAIAWAVIEHLHDQTQCRVLFATHYRELSILGSTLQKIQCNTLKVQEWKGEVVFYHKIIEGIADKSYGIHVASISGVPKSVVKRAEILLKDFEKKDQSQNSTMFFDFSSVGGNEAETHDDLYQKLQNAHIDSMTPKQALDFLYELKQGIV